jgi:hypothetical protein
MAEVLTGAEREQFVDVLAEWDVGGSPAPVEWAGRAEKDRQEYLPGVTPKAIKKALYDYARRGGEIHRVDEGRSCEDYERDWKYHYDLWPTIRGKVYYFETRFHCSTEPDESVIYIMRFKLDSA